jgi:hypothetical protein
MIKGPGKVAILVAAVMGLSVGFTVNRAVAARSNSIASAVPARHSNKRVVDWFARYDAIRHAAQMKKAEKRNAHKLISAVLSGDSKDKLASKTLVESMSARYDVAIRDLSKLPYIPETGELQSKYLNYFKTSKQFLTSYLKEVNRGISPATVSQIHDARRNIASIDMSNKALDRELRKKYHIEPYKWD